jgi:hypothetical protein
LATSLNLFPVKKEIKNTNSKTSKSVYGFNPSTSEYQTWPSISESTKFFFFLLASPFCTLARVRLLKAKAEVASPFSLVLENLPLLHACY